MGAVSTYPVPLNARTSLRTGPCPALGVATADWLYALASTLGGSAPAAALRPAPVPLRGIRVPVRRPGGVGHGDRRAAVAGTTGSPLAPGPRP